MGNFLSSPAVQSAGDLGVQCSRNEAELKNLKMKHGGATETISSLEEEVKEQKRIVQMLRLNETSSKPCDSVRAKLAEVSQERGSFEAKMKEANTLEKKKHAEEVKSLRSKIVAEGKDRNMEGQVYSTKLKKLEEMNHELRKQRDALSLKLSSNRASMRKIARRQQVRKAAPVPAFVSAGPVTAGYSKGQVPLPSVINSVRAAKKVRTRRLSVSFQADIKHPAATGCIDVRTQTQGTCGFDFWGNGNLSFRVTKDRADVMIENATSGRLVQQAFEQVYRGSMTLVAKCVNPTLNEWTFTFSVPEGDEIVSFQLAVKGRNEWKGLSNVVVVAH
tara:strand:+ start:1562 stop:2557 length:996 start_codon:yes stop_codon:yes gene_type:complete